MSVTLAYRLMEITETRHQNLDIERIIPLLGIRH